MMTLDEARQLSGHSLQSKIGNYVVNRQNEDRGYTFCRGAESNAQDACYGLAILNLLKTKFPNVLKNHQLLKKA